MNAFVTRRFFLLLALALLSVISAEAQIVTKSIEYKDGATVLRGYLAYDSTRVGSRPGVLLVHEWWGHNEYIQKRARDYAAQGYLAFAVDMYGADQQGVTVAEASALSKPFYDDRNLMRNRARAGLTAFISAAKEAGQHLDAHRISALGYCFGGTVALELARSGAPVRSTVVFHGGLGTPDRNLAKKIKGSILVLNGADDPMVPAEERNQFMQEMRDGGVDWQFVEYGGALHAFSNPAVDEKGIPGARYNKRADDRSFALSCAYLAEQLAG